MRTAIEEHFLTDPQAWEDLRADLCHDWIKNGLLVGIGKVRRILEGTVEDSTGIAEFRAALHKAESQLAVAEALVKAAPRVLSPIALLSVQAAGSKGRGLRPSEFDGLVRQWESRSGIKDLMGRADKAIDGVKRQVHSAQETFEHGERQ